MISSASPNALGLPTGGGSEVATPIFIQLARVAKPRAQGQASSLFGLPLQTLSQRELKHD